MKLTSKSQVLTIAI